MVAPVGLDEVTYHLRNQRRCHHLAVMLERDQLAYQSVATRLCFVDKPKPDPLPLPLCQPYKRLALRN